MMRKICVINQKGGVGKTTTVLNLAIGLARKDKRVLVVDLDPQGNIGTCLCAASEKNIYHILVEDEDPQDCIVSVEDNLDIITSDSQLAKAELIMSGMPSRETVLKRKLEGMMGYDYILVDCAPSVNLLNQNALLYATEAFIPVSTDYLSVDALRKIEATIEELNSLFNHNLRISTVIPTMYDKRLKSNLSVLSDIKRGFSARVCKPITVNSKLKEAPKSGESIYDYAKSSRGAEDYNKLVEKVITNEYLY